jgi:hypothetical protein
MRLAAITALALLTILSDALAQRRCRKGIPCGGTCIAANKTCRVGSGGNGGVIYPGERIYRTYSEYDSVAKARTAAAPKREVAKSSPNASSRPASLSIRLPTSNWVGSKADRVYFKLDCPAAKDLAPANRRYFDRVAAATAAGFRRSRVPGC